MQERIATLIDRLHAKTKARALAWERNPEGNFQTSFPDYTVELSEDDDLNFWIQIYNEEGEKVEAVSDTGLRRLGMSSTKLLELHDMARRMALGSDEAIEKLIAALEE